MEHRPNPEFLHDVTGALDWWRDAGVDCNLLDEPLVWFAEPTANDIGAPAELRPEPGPERGPELAPVRKPVGRADRAAGIDTGATAPRLDAAALPADLAAFPAWWLSEPLLDNGPLASRVAPQGHAGAKLMVVVEEPEAGDRESLLSGPQGRLLDAILAAFGIRREDVYLASALPRHTPGADWASLAARGLGKVLAHHVHLVGPERLFVLGGNVLPLVGNELPQRPAVLRSFNHEGVTIPLLASWALPALLGQPRAKPVLWRAWLEWTAA